MPMIRPSSDLRNKYNEISSYCKENNEPVFITKNGANDLVVLTNEYYEYLCGKAELHRLLDEGLDACSPGSGKVAEDVFSSLGERFGFENEL